ncbi:hypothetical protein V2J09_004165 [Rumex salicifolius]
MDGNTHQQYASALEKYHKNYPTMSNSSLITISIGEDILNYSQQVHVGKEQIRLMITRTQRRKKRDIWRIQCPNKKRESLWFAPYNQGSNWMLINPWNNILYWLDPLRNGVPDTVLNKDQILWIEASIISRSHLSPMTSIFLMRFVNNGSNTWRHK